MLCCVGVVTLTHNLNVATDMFKNNSFPREKWFPFSIVCTLCCVHEGKLPIFVSSRLIFFHLISSQVVVVAVFVVFSIVLAATF